MLFGTACSPTHRCPVAARCFLHAYTLQLRCRVLAGTAEEVGQLARAAPQCSALCLPAAPPAADGSFPAAWTAQRRIQAAVQRLLLSPAFWGRNACCLGELLSCPLSVAQSGALAGYSALHRLGLCQGLCIGQPAALRGSDLPGLPPSLAQLDLRLSDGVTLDALRWQPRVVRFAVFAPAGSHSSGAGTEYSRPALPLIRLQPCCCAGCCPAGAGFWPSLRSLHVEAARVEMHLDACRALRSCHSLRIVARLGSQAAPAAAAGQEAEPQAGAAAEGAADGGSTADLEPWLAALAQLFASTALHRVEIVAGGVSLDGLEGAQSAMLRAAAQGMALPVARAQLTVATLPPGSCQLGAHRSLVAELRRSFGGTTLSLSVCKAT